MLEFSHFLEAFLKIDTGIGLNVGRISILDSLHFFYLDISLTDSTLLQSNISNIDLFSLFLRRIGGVVLVVDGSPGISLLIICDILMARQSS